MSACRSCGAEIIWAFTAGRRDEDEDRSSRRIPLDAKPIEKMTRGAFVLARGVELGEPVAIDANWFYAGRSPMLARLPALFITHFATCPNADRHRRPRA